jgi:hypothetical protein
MRSSTGRARNDEWGVIDILGIGRGKGQKRNERRLTLYIKISTVARPAGGGAGHAVLSMQCDSLE